LRIDAPEALRTLTDIAARPAELSIEHVAVNLSLSLTSALQ